MKSFFKTIIIIIIIIIMFCISKSLSTLNNVIFRKKSQKGKHAKVRRERKTR